MFVTQGGMNRLLLMGLFCLMLVSQTLAQGSLTVTNTGDSGAGSLRDAITTANSTPGTVITFNIPNTDSGCNAATGVCTITPASPLPGITAANTTIDGYTQSGASANTLSVGDNANLKIQITGTNAGDTGLLLRGGNDVVRGLIINGFQPASNGTSGGAIDLMSNNNAVTGCWLGTDTTGTAVANNYRGVWINTNPGQNIYHSDNNVVGGTTPAARNIISGNANTGVQIIFGPTGNLVQGNYIGTDKNGAAALSNGEGVVIDVANNNTIGGAAAGTGNVISGNTNGVRVDTGGGNESSGRNNTIAGNLIGLNAAGAAAIPNGTGITFGYYGSGNTVGGAGDGAGNVISGNTGDGINLNGTNAGSNTIQGNIIGLNQAGTAKIGNGGNGITFGNTTGSSVIGGTTAPMRNVISGNGGNGITDNTGGNIIQGNYIGTNISGSVALGNTNAGILITQGGDTIGGTATGAGNVLSGNGFDGIIINGAKTGGSTIQGNLIGLNAVGTAALGNHGLGVNIINGSSQNTIGGTTALARNVISGNGSNGVGIGGNNGTTSGANTANNTVQGNYIGTNAAGTAALPNALAGVDIISGASGNLIGGVSDGQSNLIAFNTGDGVHVQDATTLNNSIRGNSIHDNGKLGINLVGGTENAAGVTANGTNPRSGPNKLQNYPVITNVSVASDNTTITGTLTSTPNATFTLDFYRNTVTDPTGFGEGQVYIGSQNATTAQNGQTTFTFTATGTGQSFTATATDNAGNTSEFSRAAQAATSSSFGSNLIVNPGAEAGPGSTSGNDIEPVPGWTTSGNFTVIPYGPNNGGITTTDPGPPSRGKNYFAGGPNNAASSATQTINVSSGATAIDAGGVTFNLSGFLGGFAEQEDNAVLAITFKSAAGAALGNAHIGPVTAAERKSATGLVQRTITGTVPRGTRSILVTLTLTRTAGSYNDGYADNLTLTLTQPTSSACAVPPAGLVAWYRAEGNANDSSGNGHNGTLQGSATFTTGKVGQAFSFNGVNSFVQVPSSPALDPIQAATYDAWVYFNQLPSAAGHTMQIVAKSGSGRDLDLQAETDNKFHFYVAGGTTVVSKIVIQSSHWYYIAATYRATDRIAIYVNGVLDNTTLIPGVTRQANGNPLTIGENFTFRGRYFNGRIDEVSLYNLAMSAAEIRANYVAGSSGQCAGSTPPGITVTPTSGLVTTEAGGKATFTVKLNSQPKANVTIGLKSSNPSNGTVSPASLTFTSTNWNTPHTVTVTGVKDNAHTPREPYQIITAPAVSTDTQYNGLNAADVQVTNLDNVGQPTITLTPLTATLHVGQQQQFLATVTGLGKVTINWRVQESNSGGAITTTGLYTAPEVPGHYHVVVTVAGHPELVATAVVNVVAQKSSLGLSSGQADSAKNIVLLNFAGELDAATAADAIHYSVLVSGHTTTVEGAAYDAAKHRVLLSLSEGALQAGNKVLVTWSNLRDAEGQLVADGKVNLVAK